ncbi:MAG: hypothetical protein V1820_04585 [archaeon]
MSPKQRNDLMRAVLLFALFLAVLFLPTPAYGNVYAEIYDTSLRFSYSGIESGSPPAGGENATAILSFFIRRNDSGLPGLLNLTSVELYYQNATFLGTSLSCFNWNLWGLSNSSSVKTNSSYTHGVSAIPGGLSCNATRIYFTNGTEAPWEFPLGYPIENTTTWNESSDMNLSYSPKYTFVFRNFTLPPQNRTYSLYGRGLVVPAPSVPGQMNETINNATISFNVAFPVPVSNFSISNPTNASRGASILLLSVNSTDSSGVPVNATRISFNVSGAAAFSEFYVLNQTGSQVSFNSSFSEGAVSLSLGNSLLPAGFSVYGNLSKTGASPSNFTVSFSPRGGLEYGRIIGSNASTMVIRDSNSSSASTQTAILNLSSFSANSSVPTYGRQQSRVFNLTLRQGDDAISCYEIFPVLSSGFSIVNASPISGNATCVRNSSTLATCFILSRPTSASEEISVSVNATAPSASGTYNWSVKAVNFLEAFSTVSSVLQTVSQGAASLNSSTYSALPVNITIGQTGVSVRFKVNNTGEASLFSVTPNLTIVHSNSSLAAIVPSISPSSFSAIQPGSSEIFSVSFSVPASYSAGTLAVFFNASGIDANTGALVSTSANSTSNTTVLIPAALNIFSASIDRAVAYLSRNFTASVSVFNGGQNVLRYLSYSIQPNSTSGLSVSTVSVADAQPGNFSNFSFTVFVSPTAAVANLTFNLTFSGTDGPSGVVVSNRTDFAISIQSPFEIAVSNTTLYDVEGGKGANISVTVFSRDGLAYPGTYLKFTNQSCCAIAGNESRTVSASAVTYSVSITPIENLTKNATTHNLYFQAVSATLLGAKSEEILVSVGVIPRIICGGKDDPCCASGSCRDGNLCCGSVCKVASEGKCCSDAWKASFLCCADLDCGEGRICALANGTCVEKPFGEPEANKLLSDLSNKLADLKKRILEADKTGKDTEAPSTITEAIDLKMRNVKNLILDKRYLEAKKLIEDTGALFTDAETALVSAPEKPSGFALVLVFLSIVVVSGGVAGYYYMQKGKVTFSAAKIFEKGLNKIYKTGLAERLAEVASSSAAKKAPATKGPSFAVQPAQQKYYYPPTSYYQMWGGFSQPPQAASGQKAFSGYPVAPQMPQQRLAQQQQQSGYYYGNWANSRQQQQQQQQPQASQRVPQGGPQQAPPQRKK